LEVEKLEAIKAKNEALMVLDPEHVQDLNFVIEKQMLTVQKKQENNEVIKVNAGRHMESVLEPGLVKNSEVVLV